MGKACKAAKQHHNRPNKGGTALDAERALRQAEAALAQGVTDGACKILAQARDLRSLPEGQRVAVAAYTAQACERWDRPGRALEPLERALEVAPADAELRRLRGTVLRRLGRLRAAVAELEQARRLAPGDGGIAFEALLAHLAAGDRGPELAALAADSGPAADLAAALLVAAGGELAQAAQALARAPQPLAKLMRAIVLLAEGETHAALPALRQSAAADSLPGPVAAYANFYLGLALARRRELESATRALEKALELGLPRELARDHLAWAYNQLVIDAVLDHDLARATDWLTKLSEAGGPMAEAARENVAYALRLCGQEKAQAGDYEEAVRHWTRALEIRPRDFALRQNLAVALERANRADEAIPHWHELAQQLAKASLKSGKAPASSAAKEQHAGPATTDEEALAIHVRAVAHRHLADLYLEEDDLERAIPQLERAVAVAPDEVDTRTQLVGLLIENGTPAKALPHLERLLAQRPDSAAVLMLTASAHRVLGNVEACLAALERAYALLPDDPLVSQALGLQHATRALEAPSAATAEADARRALELLPRGRILGLLALGAVQLAQGNRKEAVKTLKRCLREAGDKANAALEVGHVYWRAGEREPAAEAWAQAMKKAKRAPELFVALAAAWAKAGDLARCQDCFKELLKRGFTADAMDAADLVMALPQGKAFLRRVLTELIPSAADIDDNMFLADGLLRVGDLPTARTLINKIALDSIADNYYEGIIFATNFDVKYKYKILDHKTAVAVANWLDTYQLPLGLKI